MDCSRLLLATVAAVGFVLFDAMPVWAADEVDTIVSAQTGIRTSPNTSASVEAADLMGNGDLLVSTVGPPEAYAFNLSKNDFWLSRPDGIQIANPLMAGVVKLRMPGNAGASYRQEQDISKGEVRAIFIKGQQTITVTSRVLAADANHLMIEIENAGDTAFPVTVETYATTTHWGDTIATSDTAGVDDAHHITWLSRKSPDYAQAAFVMRCAVATEVFGTTATTFAAGSTGTSSFTVTAHQTVTILSAVNVTGNSLPLTKTPGDPVPGAVQLLTRFTSGNLAAHVAHHREWWSRFWLKSYISIPSQARLEKYYYGALYVLACSNRAGKSPAGLNGWNDSDNPMWAGDYHTNYNFQAPYYGVYSSNRPELAAGYYLVTNDFALTTGLALAKARGSKGTYFPVGFGPFGIISTNSDLNQKTDGVELAVQYINHYFYTYDSAWARTMAYPFLKQVADFWDNDLGSKDPMGRYVIRDSAVAEGDLANNVNATSALAFLKYFYKGMLQISKDLDADHDRRAKWQDIEDHLSDYPTGTRNGKTVFAFSEKSHSTDANEYGYNLYPVFPGNQVGLTSPLAQVAIDTIDNHEVWQQNNSFCEIFPVAARVGYPVKALLSRMNAAIGDLPPNLFHKQSGGGLETCGAIEAINCMLFQSTEGILKFFPVWNGSDAKFANLRAVGAFLVSAELANGTIGPLMITSEQGNRCCVKDPWPEPCHISEEGGGPVAASISGDVYIFKTKPGARYTIRH